MDKTEEVKGLTGVHGVEGTDDGQNCPGSSDSCGGKLIDVRGVKEKKRLKHTSRTVNHNSTIAVQEVDQPQRGQLLKRDAMVGPVKPMQMTNGQSNIRLCHPHLQSCLLDVVIQKFVTCECDLQVAIRAPNWLKSVKYF